MRLKHVKGADEKINASSYCVRDAKEYKGRWKDLFSNNHPIYLEIGTGKGQFLTTLAKNHPQINYLGIEMYSSVLVRAVEKLEAMPEEERPKNIFFIRFDATDLLEAFAEGEIARIYLNFSDPWPKDRHAKRRLTSRRFLDRYDVVLAKDGVVEFKTDNQDLFTFSLEEVEESKWEFLAKTRDLHHEEELCKGNVMTEYEEKFSSMGNPICKMIIRR